MSSLRYRVYSGGSVNRSSRLMNSRGSGAPSDSPLGGFSVALVVTAEDSIPENARVARTFCGRAFRRALLPQ
ncbi:MAG TPA: hypothetical protein VJX66_21755, partial [Amycolatopsis sp.]|nr:hypothetical protein [Amycolatopsis sp.]